MAGGGIKGGYSHGETDPVGYVGIKDRTSVLIYKQLLCIAWASTMRNLPIHFKEGILD
jgi:hypothetical protein